MVGYVTAEMVLLVALVVVEFHNGRNQGTMLNSQRQKRVFVLISSKREETRVL